jgi:hypothetical protein
LGDLAGARRQRPQREPAPTVSRETDLDHPLVSPRVETQLAVNGNRLGLDRDAQTNNLAYLCQRQMCVE